MAKKYVTELYVTYAILKLRWYTSKYPLPTKILLDLLILSQSSTTFKGYFGVHQPSTVFLVGH